MLLIRFGLLLLDNLAGTGLDLTARCAHCFLCDKHSTGCDFSPTWRSVTKHERCSRGSRAVTRTHKSQNPPPKTRIGTDGRAMSTNQASQCLDPNTVRRRRKSTRRSWRLSASPTLGGGRASKANIVPWAREHRAGGIVRGGIRGMEWERRVSAAKVMGKLAEGIVSPAIQRRTRPAYGRGSITAMLQRRLGYRLRSSKREMTISAMVSLSSAVAGEHIANSQAVGISRVQSRDHSYRARPKNLEPPNGQKDSIERALSTAHDHQPFTEHDLALALSRSHLAVPVTS